MDMAVGIITGSAYTAIAASLVEDILIEIRDALKARGAAPGSSTV